MSWSGSTFGDQLIRVHKLVVAARASFPRPHPGVDPMSFPLLFTLARAPHRLSDLAAALHTEPSTLSRQISHLGSLGLVAKETDPQDGRAFVATITPAGLEVLATIRTTRDAWLADLLRDWTEDDIGAFTAYLRRFGDDVQTHLTTLTSKDLP